jgi:hypothetical protein
VSKPTQYLSFKALCQITRESLQQGIFTGRCLSVCPDVRPRTVFL